ncbi:NUDIX hydrolase domain-like protein [Apiospora arundinis]
MAHYPNSPSPSSSLGLSPMASGVGSVSPGKLSHVVIIPQRRPKQRERGFIRAYAPDLLNCGIDQAAFLAFIDGFNKAVVAHPIVSAFNLAGAAVGVVPMSVTPIAGWVSLGVQVAAEVVTEVMARSSQNSYLKKMNEELFRPHGLYCLIMAYDIKSRNDIVQFDLGTDHDAAGGSATPTPLPANITQLQARFRSNDGILGAAQFPVPADLVFFDPNNEPPPEYEDLDDSSDSERSGGKRESSGSGRGFMQKLDKAEAALETWQDLKAQVKFKKKNPTSVIGSLLHPKAELSRKDVQKQEKQEAKKERKAAKQERKAEKRLRKDPDKEPKKRKIKPGILYLMIVNMPSEEDMNQAQNLLRAEAMQRGDEGTELDQR